MNVRVASEAAARIRQRGGAIFLWEEPVGEAFVRDRLAFRPPNDRLEFRCFESAGVEVCFAPEVRARKVVVRPRRWPFRGVEARVDGKRWGRRGDGFGGDSGAGAVGW